MGNCRSSIGLVGREVFSGAAQRRWLGQDCGFTFPPHTQLYWNLPAFLWTLPFCKILKCVAVVSLSSRSSTVLAVLLTNPALPASVPCRTAEPVAIPGNSPEPWSHFDDIYQFLLTLHSIYYLFLGYFYKASFSFLIKIPHFGLYFLYIQGGLFSPSHLDNTCPVSLSSLDFSVCSTNVRDLPLMAPWCTMKEFI